MVCDVQEELKLSIFSFHASEPQLPERQGRERNRGMARSTGIDTGIYLLSSLTHLFLALFNLSLAFLCFCSPHPNWRQSWRQTNWRLTSELVVPWSFPVKIQA